MPEAREQPSVGLDVIHFATIRTPRDYVYRPEGRPLTRWWTGFRAGADALPSPCLAYVLHHPQHGPIVVDTGLHRDAFAGLANDFGFPMSIMFRALEPVGPAFDDQLRGVGVDSESVERVIMTHLHVDHTSGMRLLPNARFVCARREWDAAHNRGAAAKGFVAAHLPDAARMELVDYESAPRHGAFARTIDLLGDGSIRLLSTPGHTPGHQSLLVRTTAHGDVVLAGDAAYTLRNIDEDILPLLTDSDTHSRESLRELREHRLAHPDAPTVPSHDPDAWRALAG